jgi:antitoxin VapB
MAGGAPPMALSIKNGETERLARQVAKETGESLTKAIASSLRERLQRLRQARHGRMMNDKLDDILQRVDNLPTQDTRPEADILGYNEHGMPADDR